MLKDNRKTDACRDRSGAPPRKGGVVNGQMTKASNKRVRPVLHLEMDAWSMVK